MKLKGIEFINNKRTLHSRNSKFINILEIHIFKEGLDKEIKNKKILELEEKIKEEDDLLS